MTDIDRFTGGEAVYLNYRTTVAGKVGDAEKLVTLQYQCYGWKKVCKNTAIWDVQGESGVTGSWHFGLCSDCLAAMRGDLNLKELI